MELQGKIALVTGSAHRVGKAIAHELARRGCDIMVHYHGSVDKAAQTVEELRQTGQRVESFRADMSDPAQIAALFDEIRRAFGRLDVLVNSASIFEAGKLLEISLEDWNRSLTVNLTAPFLCIQHAEKLMPDGGAIVNISDLGGYHGDPAYPQHSVSKAGLLMLTRIAARSLGRQKIRVNAVVPGMVLAPPGFEVQKWETMAQKLPLQEDGSPEDVARAVAYLAGEDFLNGTVITVDGGEHLL
jgi:NAD(P)-dependent dehydrogenase (short-subunit alcohol dehydrogenase family)